MLERAQGGAADGTVKVSGTGRQHEIVQASATVVAIQYLRALAASLIVFHHAMAAPLLHPYYPHAFGEFGVDLFFVISGCIMWRTTVSSRRSPAGFFAARVVRIVPLYWLYTTLFLGVALLVPRALSTLPGLDPVFVLKSYLFVPAVHPHFGGVVPLYSLGWTLNYEMFFYLVFGLALLLPQPRHRIAFLAAVLLLLVSLGGWTLPASPILATYTDPLLLEFLAGVVLAVLAPRLMRSSATLGALLIAAGAGGLLLALSSDELPKRILAYGVPAAAIVAGALVLEPTLRRAVSRPGLLLGDASYSIYLAHPFAQRLWLLAVGGLLPENVGPAGLAVQVAAAVAAGLLGGVLSYRFIERPLLAAGHRLIGRRALSRRSAAIESHRPDHYGNLISEAKLPRERTGDFM
ncbi:MAG TPA: acyltransferase [Xanthobacteraceae bacterium]|jgi:peptidoglycan/LPS O-acetylase OafA/YrhL